MNKLIIFLILVLPALTLAEPKIEMPSIFTKLLRASKRIMKEGNSPPPAVKNYANKRWGKRVNGYKKEWKRLIDTIYIIDTIRVQVDTIHVKHHNDRTKKPQNNKNIIIQDDDFIMVIEMDSIPYIKDLMFFLD